ncbi:MAG: Diguanylate cyclase DosC [Spirochaetes bacterium ADurb.Bin218]|jgi:diguanylate cyclase (GGDEF)-like protein|nr:GGDEF domain-containing protein [Spirochaetota bacterium]OQA98134.1 MAG: Diguanylate cyclase DosC [Spirochaetes bacterium ADurb.Bin218]HOQ13068.1 GGDEF domain-containing protein [Spirochaetota bacterium]HPD78043.1 GGDEF domain-containing protein [Spirochaetota bacterium]HPX90410.1 GGDEF domain-containing protein [Spirochaetota bacterium]
MALFYNNQIELLKGIAIFQDLLEEDLHFIASHMRQITFKAGDILFQEGDPGEEMFVVIKGGVSVFIKDQEEQELVLTEVREGNYFGEMSIIEKSCRSATCRATEDTLLLALHADSFSKIIEVIPEAASSIMNRMLSIIVKRLMRTGAFITQMVQYGEESRKRAITDPATGLFNRRYLEESFEGLVAKAIGERQSLTFVMFDLDRFSTLNARYGQEFCDNLIVKASYVFREVFTKDDILIRYGGDEFIFIFPDTDKGKAQIKCDSLCEAMRNMKVEGHDELRLTCSMGFATLPEDATSPEELKDKADKALYMAKEKGRDRAMPWNG